jgi:hypothetical protein
MAADEIRPMIATPTNWLFSDFFYSLVRSHMKGRQFVAMAFALWSGAVVAADEPLMSCDDKYVQYSDPQAVPLKNRVVVSRLRKRPSVVQVETDKEYKSLSPQQTAAFNRVRVADTLKSGQRDNGIQVFTLNGPSYAWQIDLNDIQDNASMEWLNEDLILIRVWWGRIVSTDLIFQLSTGRFIYTQEANYGLLVQPCK